MLPQIILSKLCASEATGYDITKSFSGIDGIYWQASHQQVYREMGKMEQKGLMTHHLVPQSGKPDRKVYNITKQGLIHLKEWISSETALPILRDEIISKIAAAEKSDVPALLEDLDNVIRITGKKLDVIHQMDSNTNLHKLNPFEQTKHNLTIDRTRSHWKGILEWAQTAKSQLNRYL